MSFTVDCERSLDSTDTRHSAMLPAQATPAQRSAAVTLPAPVRYRAHAAAETNPDERPTDPAPPVHSFWIPKFPKDPGLPDVARLYEEALEHARAVEARDVPGHSTFRPAPVLRHQYRPVRLPVRSG